MADWSDLRHDLVRVIGDLLLATNDVDSYVDMRAVCHDWRAAIPKPTPLGSGDDLRFRPRQWVMLDQEDPEDGVDVRLFLHVSTGRFLRRRLPLFGYGKYILVGASDGLLVLGSAKGLHAAMLVNPFTRDMLSFAAPIPREPCVLASVAGSIPTLLFSFEDSCNFPVDMVYCADTNSPLSQVQFEDEDFYVKSVVSCAGDLYVVDYDGGILKIMGTAPNYHAELIAKTFNDEPYYYFLVDSAGELLFVSLERLSDTQDLVQVFRVDIEQKVLEPVKNIGSRALFIGARCLSVDADKLPSVDNNSIYYTDDPMQFRGCSLNRYDLNDDYKSERIQKIRPFSLAQTLLESCMYDALEYIPDQLKGVRQD